MSEFKVGDKVFWFFADSRENIYPKWLEILEGMVTWIKPDEEILHAYVDGQEAIFILLDIEGYIFHTKQDAIDAMIARLNELKE